MSCSSILFLTIIMKNFICIKIRYSMKKLTISFCILLAIFTKQISAQSNGSISGFIKDNISSDPVGFATVALYNINDTVFISGNISDSTGYFLLDQIPSGIYSVKISFVGYQDLWLENIQIENTSVDVGTITLLQAENILSEVSISADKPVVETIPGGIVYHADQVLTNESGTALDMMKTVPNIIVDKDEHISIRGNSGISVMLDGVPLNLSGDDLTNFLKQVPASMIASVEVITTPGAKYDAAGSAGILNLKTKQNKTSGKNGSLSAGIGTLGSYQAGGNFYSNQEKIRFNLSYQFNHQVFESSAEGTRENYLNPEALYLYDETFNQSGNADNHYASIGLDYLMNDKNTLGGNIHYGKDDGSFAFDDLLYTKYSSGEISGGYNSLLNYNYEGQNYSGNVHYIKKTNKEGEELDINGNISHYNHDNSTPSFSEFFDADEIIIPGSAIERNDATDFSVDIYSGKIDYTLPLKNNAKLETGIKHTFTNTSNNLFAQTKDFLSGEWLNDSLVSNDFSYKENVSAAYLSYFGSIKKLSYSLGLRAEYTDIFTESSASLINKNQNYFDLFPSGNVKYATDKSGEYSFDYSRRIERPVYQWLNPFIDKSTPYTWFTGNPELQPYYTNSFSLNYSHFIKMKYYVMGSIFYQSMQDIFTQYFEYGGDGVYYMTIKNVNNQTNIGASFMTQSSLNKWFDLLLNLSAYQTSIDNELNTTELDAKISFTAYGSATFKFWKNASFQLTANYMSPSTNPQGYFVGFYSVDAGLKKSFLEDKLTLNIGIKDMFNSMKFSNEFVDDDFSSIYSFKPISRIADIKLTWKFGDAIQNLMQDSKGEDEQRINFGGKNG